MGDPHRTKNNPESMARGFSVEVVFEWDGVMVVLYCDYCDGWVLDGLETLFGF